MTFDRSRGPGPRTSGQPDPRAQGHRSDAARARLTARAAAALLSLVAALAVAACGSAAPIGSRPPGASLAVPSGAAGPSAAADASQRTFWPNTTALGTIALGAADGEIQKAGDDLQAAADRQDLKAMWGAADGLATMIDGLMPNVARMESYPATAAAGAIYRKAFPELLAGAKQLRDAITAGNAAGVQAGALQISQGLADYAPVRSMMDALVQQALAQQRLLVK